MEARVNPEGNFAGYKKGRVTRIEVRDSSDHSKSLLYWNTGSWMTPPRSDDAKDVMDAFVKALGK